MTVQSALKGRVAADHGSTRRMRRGVSEGLAGYLFLIPWFIGLAVIVVGPMVASLYLSFTNYNPLGSPKWIGLDNYTRMFTADPRYLKAVRVTVTYVVLSVPLQLVFALLLALALDKGMRALNFYRSVYYLPSLLGGSVAIALLWRQVFGDSGLVNQVLGFFGIHAGSWIGDPDTSLYTLVTLSVWMFGAPMIIFLAGLRQIPTMYYEAAMVDGAGPLRTFFKITLPLLSPVIFFNLILQTISAFQAFTPAYVVSDGTGGPVDSTLFYTLYLYQEGFPNLRMGYASALAWVLLAVIGIITAINFVVSKYWVFYGDEG
ncbi:carbohydrate ABC transporter permease [Rhizomonospora bruguierae]|uniref:carbohydrate ABC transporter permease n=1 Tax=Rhizomonospora bruguierae TaxID=1581705 RepID=UPI001BCCCFBB|nr:sugar ABC transporter permease [Micromonospora sp. NBRC 107566]